LKDQNNPSKTQISKKIRYEKPKIPPRTSDNNKNIYIYIYVRARARAKRLKKKVPKSLNIVLRNLTN